MKSLLLLAALALLAPAASSRAADVGVVIGGASGGASAATSNETCVDVEIGGQRAPAFDCINEKLRQQVAHVQPVGNIPPLQASSSVVAVQGINATAIAEQFGPALGKSVVPFRPAPPAFSSSLGLR